MVGSGRVQKSDLSPTPILHASFWKFSKFSNSGISLNWSIIDDVTTHNTTRGEARILRLGGLSPGHGKCGSTSLYGGSGAKPRVGVQGQNPSGGSSKAPEGESSVAFEALAEEPNFPLGG